MAVNVTFVPAQIVLPGFAAIVTEGATDEVTFIVISVAVAVVGLAQLNDDVIATVIIFPFVNALFE